MIKVKTTYLQILILGASIWVGVMFNDIDWDKFVNAPFYSIVRLEAIVPILILLALFYEVYFNRRKKEPKSHDLYVVKVRTKYLQILMFVISIWIGLMISDIGWGSFINAPFDSRVRSRAIAPMLTLFALFYEVYFHRRRKKDDSSIINKNEW